MTRTRRAGVVVAAICGFALIGCGDGGSAGDAAVDAGAAAESAKASGGASADTDERGSRGDRADDGSADRRDDTARSRRSGESASASRGGAEDDDKNGEMSGGEDGGADRDGDADAKGSGDGTPSSPSDGSADSPGSGGSGGAESEGTPGGSDGDGDGGNSRAPGGGSNPGKNEPAPDGKHPGPPWTPDTLITTDLVPADGYAVANEEETLDRPSIADPCREKDLDSEAARADRLLLWWSPGGKQDTSPIVAIDGISYPAGGAAAALDEIRDRVRSCSEQSYGSGSTLKLTMADTDGLVSDSIVVEMELSGKLNGSGRAVYQHVDDMVVVTFAMYELADSDRANQLVSELALDYADRIRAGR